MGKYKLSELLNEIQGGRVGYYEATYDDFERMIEALKDFPKMKYIQKGKSKDNKIAFEHEFYPKGKEAFSIYPFKFDPRFEASLNPKKKWLFSIGGDIGEAIFHVKEAGRLMDIEAKIARGDELLKNQDENSEEMKDMDSLKEEKEGIKLTQDQMDKLHKTGVITVTGVDNNGNKVKSKLYFPKVTKENKIEEVTMANVNVDEVKMHLDAYEAGDITGDDLHQAISEIFFGEVTAPGLKEMTADEFGGDEESVERIAKFQNKSPEQVRQEVSDIEYEEIADAFKNDIPPYVDRSKFTKAQLGRMIVDLRFDGDLEAAFRYKDSKNLKEMKNQREIEKELEKIANLEEQISDDDIRKALNGRDYEIDAYMAALEVTGQKFDTIQDYIDDFEEYRADRALKEHFGRFLKNYQ